MFNNLFSKIMGSYIIIPILILLLLLLILPNYLKDYFYQAKERELLGKGQAVAKIISENDYSDSNISLSNLEKLLDTSLIIINQEREIINQGMRLQGMMRSSWMRKMHHNQGRGMMNRHGMMKHNRTNPPQVMMNFSDELNKVLAGDATSFRGETPMLNQAIIGVGIPIRTSEEMALFLISPLRGLEETVVKVRNLTIRVSFIAILIALILGYFISKGITRPVKEMKDKARLMAAGNFKAKIDKLPNDEIGELGKSFNYLSTKLESNINELTTEKRRMEEMLSSMAEGVLGVSKDQRILLANPRLKEILEIDKEIIGAKFNACFNDTLLNLVEEVMLEEKELKEEFNFGDKIIVAHAAPITKTDDELWGIIILVRDVTEIRKLDEMRRLFVANVSHELKTPLTAIRGYLEAILDGVVEDIDLQSEYLNRVLSETTRMTRLVQDTLDLSRLQSGQMDFKASEFDLIVLINSVIINLEGRLEDRDVSIEASESLIVKSDRDRIEEVLINLLSNAIKFTTSDGKIELKVKKIEAKVKVKVIDDGIGIPTSELPYIWERFHQVDRARTPDQKGTGLGLAIVKEIVEGLGGKVEVESEAGKGSEFSFTIESK
ncbi:ATP-binding protein [Orenia marismortui]|uniref:histidine kinase n=1 Tax=Orenia marismortui TaxID=46469 RepID=A0A4R8GVY1_9FIRM|nr:ATP-binding protein [Orenia marismortui]TDX49208.1 two-component system sensor histidine kinase ResE [Orenia marismortui]